MPDTESRTATTHPMDPRYCESLSPMFQAFLCWLLDLPPVTEPAITGVALAGDSVLAATDAPTVENLVAKLRSAGRT